MKQIAGAFISTEIAGSNKMVCAFGLFGWLQSLEILEAGLFLLPTKVSLKKYSCQVLEKYVC